MISARPTRTAVHRADPTAREARGRTESVGVRAKYPHRHAWSRARRTWQSRPERRRKMYMRVILERVLGKQLMRPTKPEKEEHPERAERADMGGRSR